MNVNSVVEEKVQVEFVALKLCLCTNYQIYWDAFCNQSFLHQTHVTLGTGICRQQSESERLLETVKPTNSHYLGVLSRDVRHVLPLCCQILISGF